MQDLTPLPLNIIWLASYPKSGNTWLRFLIYSYFYGPAQSSREIERVIPDVHALPNTRLEPSLTGTYICKTHFLWNQDHPNYEQTTGFIYILRHPKDVLLSNLNYFKLFTDQPIDPIVFSRQFIKQGGSPYWKNYGVGSWHENIVSWLEAPSVPFVALRYEDLHQNPSKCLQKVIRFFGHEPDQNIIDQAVAASSFDNLKALEDMERKESLHGTVFQVHPDQELRENDFRFMRRGQTGQSLGDIHPGLDKLFDEQFGDFLDRYGYST